MVLQTLKEHNPRSILLGMNMQRYDGSMCDVRIQVGDQHVFAHQAVLAANSDYFLTRFTGSFRKVGLSMAEMNMSEDFPDLDMAEMIIHSMYTGELDITPNNVCSLYEVSSYLLYETVKQACVDYMVENLSLENCLEYWQTTHNNISAELHTSVTNLLQNRFHDFFIYQEDLRMVERSTVSELLKADMAKFCSTKQILDFLVDWYLQSKLDEPDVLGLLVTEAKLSCDHSASQTILQDVGDSLTTRETDPQVIRDLCNAVGGRFHAIHVEDQLDDPVDGMEKDVAGYACKDVQAGRMLSTINVGAENNTPCSRVVVGADDDISEEITLRRTEQAQYNTMTKRENAHEEVGETREMIDGILVTEHRDNNDEASVNGINTDMKDCHQRKNGQGHVQNGKRKLQRKKTKENMERKQRKLNGKYPDIARGEDGSSISHQRVEGYGPLPTSSGYSDVGNQKTGIRESDLSTKQFDVLVAIFPSSTIVDGIECNYEKLRLCAYIQATKVWVDLATTNYPKNANGQDIHVSNSRLCSAGDCAYLLSSSKVVVLVLGTGSQEWQPVSLPKSESAMKRRIFPLQMEHVLLLLISDYEVCDTQIDVRITLGKLTDKGQWEQIRQYQGPENICHICWVKESSIYINIPDCDYMDKATVLRLNLENEDITSWPCTTPENKIVDVGDDPHFLELSGWTYVWRGPSESGLTSGESIPRIRMNEDTHQATLEIVNLKFPNIVYDKTAAKDILATSGSCIWIFSGVRKVASSLHEIDLHTPEIAKEHTPPPCNVVYAASAGRLNSDLFAKKPLARYSQIQNIRYYGPLSFLGTPFNNSTLTYLDERDKEDYFEYDKYSCDYDSYDFGRHLRDYKY